MEYIKNEGIANGVTVYRKANKARGGQINEEKKKVAAYCRVSTNLEIQDSSLELQMDTYNRIIEEHSGWILTGIYADRGSGTRTSKRPEFNRMIEDARAGKIDVILAKSLSRFARNTVDALQFTRELRCSGVSVYFEKEKIDTASVSSEFLLTIFAAFAQEESHSISENIKRGIRNRFKLGQPRYTRMLGYDREWKITEDAWIVEKIFNLAFDGKSKREIADILNSEGIVSSSGVSRWSHNSIYGILKNEKYTGDVLMQKSYVGDHMRHNKVYNKNLEIDCYYKEDHHEGIIDKELFKALKFDMYLKRGKYGADQTPYYGLLKCPECGQSMVKIPGIYTEKRPMWVCPGEDKAATLSERRSCKKLILLSTELDRVVNDAIDKMDHQPGYEEAIKKYKELTSRTGKPSYCRLVPLISSMTIENNNSLVINWRMGWSKKYRINPVENVGKQWIAIAKAYIENMEVDGKIIHKIKHPYRRR